MSKKYMAALISSVLGIGFLVYHIAVSSKDNRQYGILDTAMVLFIELVIMLIAGLLLLVMKDTRQIGNGVLLGVVITLVIGFGICSAA
ncbi:MAG: hypothetical protein H7Y01_02410 [Ferruginibacter sp.]|nr:hypothetical protein [Chitinophagaceae bacterium]